jgi:SAM-dependent methyltransferase
MASHRDRILDQFTRQAVPFSTAPGIRDEAALRLLVQASGAGPDDTVLDVACGPGLVVCAFARVARHATGIDVTPAMLARGRELAARAGLTNVTFVEGDVTRLPWEDATFSIVESRFAFHHLEHPAVVLAEMRRVCRPGGRVVVCDLTASPDPAKAAAFDRIEILRDPSHVRALTLADLRALFAAGGLGKPEATFYRLEFELEGLLERSFPRPEDVETIRTAYVASVEDDALGLGTHRVGDQVRAAYAIAILAATAS